MPDQSFYRGQIHSNHKFGLPTHRTYRQAYGHDMGQDRPADRWVFWVTVVCFSTALLLVGF